MGNALVVKLIRQTEPQLSEIFDNEQLSCPAAIQEFSHKKQAVKMLLHFHGLSCFFFLSSYSSRRASSALTVSI